MKPLGIVFGITGAVIVVLFGMMVSVTAAMGAAVALSSAGMLLNRTRLRRRA